MIAISFDDTDDPIDFATTSGWNALVAYVNGPLSEDDHFFELDSIVNDQVVVDVGDLIEEIENVFHEYDPQDEEVVGVLRELLHIAEHNRKRKHAYIAMQGL